jgi:hypothetical protein
LRLEWRRGAGRLRWAFAFIPRKGEKMKRIRSIGAALVFVWMGAWSGWAQAEPAGSYSWRQPQAKVLSTGDLEWAPRPFVFEKGPSVRYIDFEGGDDGNAGSSKDQPWKHHPWDAEATGKAKACTGIHTYVFKRGVIYRGRLTGKESGAPGNPIRLTSDPSWGQGEACIFGSERITGGWKKADAESAPGIPEPEKVWYIDLPDLLESGLIPHGMWETRGEETVRIPIARDPNWTDSHPRDPHTEWYVWEGTKRGIGALDTKSLTNPDPHFYEGGHVWTEWFPPPFGNMCTDHYEPIKSYWPEHHALQIGSLVKAGNRYYIEDVAGVLDSPGEFFYVQALSKRDKLLREKANKPDPGADAIGNRTPGRLYVRLPGDRDPNTASIEISLRKHLIELLDLSHITISGLRFSFDDQGIGGEGWPPFRGASAAVRVRGDCKDITVSHCRFFHVQGALVAFAHCEDSLRNRGIETPAVMDRIAFTDCDVAFSDRTAVSFYMPPEKQLTYFKPWGDEAPMGVVERVDILRNRFYHIASRPGSSMIKYGAIPAIHAVKARRIEVAGNIIDTCWGSGIFVVGGKSNGELQSVPLIRNLIHHNKVTHSVKGCNDFGGIAAWQGGPQYVYNNISGDAIGYKEWAKDKDSKWPWKTQAPAFYLDGSYKTYVFNNIAWGVSSDLNEPYRNYSAYNCVIGFMNQFFNNTIYNIVGGVTGSSGQRAQVQGNVILNTSHAFRQNAKGDLTVLGGGQAGDRTLSFLNTCAYQNNILYGNESVGGISSAKGGRTRTVADVRKHLEECGAMVSQFGIEADAPPLRDPKAHDFRPTKDSAAIDRGVKYFVPWSLYATVGEWNFYKNRAAPDRIVGENFYMTEEYINRTMYYEIPSNDLTVPGAAADWYTNGELEDWIEGALVFDGQSRYAVYPHAEMTKSYATTDGHKEPMRVEHPGDKRRTVDMNTCNFLIEMIFRADPGATGGTLVSKRNGAGYRLGIAPDGNVFLELAFRGGSCRRTGSQTVRDGQWHHVIAEVDRSQPQGIALYVDGKAANGAWTGTMPDKDVSLSNTSDFWVGRDSEGDFFQGAVDFLRVCQGTLRDADTTIEELYAWQFDGPFLRDLRNQAPTGAKRDAGAIEFQP